MIDTKSSTAEDVKDSVSEETVNDKKTSASSDDKVAIGLRNDLINERKKRQEYEAKLKQYEDAELVKNGEIEKVLNQTKSELEALKTQKEQLDNELSKWKEFETKQREKYKTVLGDIPNLETIPFDTLEYLASKSNTKLPDTDNSKPATPTGIKLTEAQKLEAKEKFSYLDSKEAEETYIRIFLKPKDKKGK